MRKLVSAVTLLLMMSSGLALARENALVDVKVVPLPGSRIRVDFKFSQSLTHMPASFITQKPSRLVLDFVNSSNQLSGKMRSQNLNLTALQKYRVVGVGNRVRAILDLNDSVAYTGHRHGSTYSLIINGNVKQTKEAFLTEEGIKAAKLKKKALTGKRISLNFQDIPVRSVLQLLADFTGINVVVSDSVSGNITIRLSEIPWDQALDIILTTRLLGKRRHGNVMLIAPASEIAEREKKELESQEKVKKLAPLRSDFIQINYAKASELVALIKDKTNSLLSARGVVSVDARTNTVWVQDTSAKIEEMRALIAKLDIPVKQVLIESRIVTVTKDFSQDLGIRFGISRPRHLSGALAGANSLEQGSTVPANVVSLSNRLNLDLAAAPATGTPASVGIALARLGDGILLDLELSALETESKGQVIASPRLITTNQQAAVIESGQEIPYQQATSGGATAVAFKKAVLSLKVTPQITSDGKIMMDLQINQDIPSIQTFNGVPAINTKEIQTNVLVNNGQTIVLGGIYEQEKNQTINRVPFLGELPIVGRLFRNRAVSFENEELLIFITPKIITNAPAMTTVGKREKANDAKV